MVALRWAIAALAACGIARADDHIFGDGFEAPPVYDYCWQAAQDPLVQPAGRVGITRPWNSAFYSAPFYTATTYLHPVGSITMGDRPQAGAWLSIEFTPTTQRFYRLDWAEAQSLVFPVRYNGRPAHSAYLTISPCPGDFRLPVPSSGDNYLRPGCRKSGNLGQINFNTLLTNSTSANCALRVGETYYLNVGFFEPGETDPLAHTCISGDRCEINVQPQ